METRSWTILNSLALRRRDELIAEDGERGHIRPRVPSANNDAASLAPAGEAGQEIGRLEGDMDEMRELVSRSNLNETDQKIVRVEGDVDKMERELAGLSSVRANLTGLQE
ncbi:hypothetical protein MY4038_006585 [Beauveria bassiana]